MPNKTICTLSKYLDIVATKVAPPNHIIKELNQQQLKPKRIEKRPATTVFL